MTNSFSNFKQNYKKPSPEKPKNSSFITIQRRTSSCKMGKRSSMRLSANARQSLTKNKKSKFNHYFIQKINKHIEFAGEFIQAKMELQELIKINPIPENIYYVTQMLKSLTSDKRDKILKQYFNHFLQNLKSFKFLKEKSPPQLEDVQKRMVEMPELEKKKTLILDLDETLIHCENKEKVENEDLKVCIDVEVETGKTIKVRYYHNSLSPGSLLDLTPKT